jgi:hypothetical protein
MNVAVSALQDLYSQAVPQQEVLPNPVDPVWVEAHSEQAKLPGAVGGSAQALLAVLL